MAQDRLAEATFFSTFITRMSQSSPRTASWTNTTCPSMRATPSPSLE